MKKLAFALAAALMIAATGCGDSKSPILTYVARSNSDGAPHLFTLNETTQASTAVSIPIPSDAFDVSPNSDASKVVYTRDGDNGWDIFLMGTDGVEKELTTGADAWAPVFSPDGKTIAFVGDTNDDQVYTMGVDGSNITPVFAAAGEEEEMPAFSPDGKSLVFWAWSNTASANDRRVEMRQGHPVGRLHGPGKQQTAHHAVAHVTGFSDDGLYQVGISGSTPTLIYSTDWWWGQPVFTGDGKTVLFTMYDGTEDNVFSVKLDGSGLTPLTTGTDTESISPVAYKNVVLFNRYNSDSSSWDIYVMNPDGSGQTLVHSTADTWEALVDSYFED